ncbi:C40 family peptidase [Terrabacter terrigena]|uniref:C40 family peptidase n=1 Tax=Terrabacter terrigena TaxID=574718 RepID=A0ABW3N4M0_9MICO
MPATSSARPGRHRRPARRLPLHSLALAPLVGAALLLGTGAAPPASSTAPPAAAQSATPVTEKGVNVATAPVATVPRRIQALRLAAAQVGKPYRWGAAGPYAFDCSGLIYYVYRTRLHIAVPRTANAQRLATVRVAKANILAGDLVFFMRAGRAYHVGVYAGNGKVWHSPRPGQRVQLSRLWTTAWVAGRVR